MGIYMQLVEFASEAPVYHLVVEGLLILWVLWLLFRKSYNPRELSKLTEKEKEELIEEWTPEPLISPSHGDDHIDLPNHTIDGKVGKHVMVDGKDCLNLASHNYLGMLDNDRVEQAATNCIDKYGVGSCGPRAFYGTVDVHLDLEAKIAAFMSAEECILYSYGFSTVASAIPAYAKRGDIIFVDEGVHFAIQKGLDASRSHIKYFKHNNADDLERQLMAQADHGRKNPRKAAITRTFVVVEGIYMNYGDICPLPAIMGLKKEFRFRLFIDENVSFGVLGKTGRGITEHFNILMADVDMVCGTLEHSLGSIGGFATGSTYVIDHQRLSGLGYCFSASLPPLLAAAAATSLDLLLSNPSLILQLKEVCERVHNILSQLPGFKVVGVSFSPIKHLQVDKEHLDKRQQQAVLRRFADKCLERGLAVVVAAYLDGEVFPPPPSIRIACSVGLGPKDLDFVREVIVEAAEQMWD